MRDKLLTAWRWRLFDSLIMSAAFYLGVWLAPRSVQLRFDPGLLGFPLVLFARDLIWLFVRLRRP